MFAHFYKTAILLAVCCPSLIPVSGHGEHPGRIQHQADIYFLLDCSASIWIVDYEKMLKFVADLVSEMEIGPLATRVGVGVFSTEHKVHVPVSNHFNKDQLQDEIMKTPYLKGNTFISRALKGMMDELLSPNSVRPGVPLITVLLTDGMSRHKQLASDNATLAKREGIFIFTVGIGNGVDRNELRAMASDPKSVYNYYVSGFEHLKDIFSQLSLRISEVDFLQSDEGTCGDNSKVDVVFVFDESALGENDTQKVKKFIASLVKDLSMNSGKVRVGIVSSTCHDRDKTLGQYLTKEEFIIGLQSKDGPDISGLVKRARSESFLPENGARFDAKQRIVLILHDNVSRRVETVRQVSKAKHAGIEVFVIQLGKNYDTHFINRLASNKESIKYPGPADELVKSELIKSFLSSIC